MKITFFDTTESEKNALTELLKGHDLQFYSEKLSIATAVLAKDSEVVSVFSSPVNQVVLDLLPNAKLIQTRTTGFDHLDIPVINASGRSAANVPGYGSRTVAEFTFALILCLSRKIFTARHQVLEGGDMSTSVLRGFELFGKTLGVIGTGRIGKNVIKIANGFGMKVLAYDVFPDLNFAKEQNFEYMELEAVMRAADIVTLHAPYNEKSHHLINKGNIGWMKKGSYLINTARGELVETDALLSALEKGDLAGAGIDVLEGERALKEESLILRESRDADFKTLYEDHVLMDMPNVILTPHVAFNTNEGVYAIIEITAETIKAFAAGAPINLL